MIVEEKKGEAKAEAKADAKVVVVEEKKDKKDDKKDDKVGPRLVGQYAAVQSRLAWSLRSICCVKICRLR